MDLSIFNSNALRDLLISNDVEELKLFGSCVRNEETESSDIDLIVTFKKNPGLFSYIRLERELSELLGKKIDLLTEKSIHEKLKAQILNEAKVIYHAEG